MDLIDPRTGAVRGALEPGRAAEVTAAVAAARAARTGWAALTPRERHRRLAALADLIERHADAYLSAECAGTGKPAAEAAGEIAEVADLFRFYGGAVRAGTSPAAGDYLAGHQSWVRWEPVGTVAAVVPWNYPLLMAGWRCAPALAAGNTVVLKPAETTPDSALLLAEHAEQALGPGVLTALPGDRETGRQLIAAGCDLIAFTGSPAGGAEVVERAGLTPVSLELGGNSPVLVLPDAPADTWRQLAAACTYNAGQSCAAPARVIVLAEAYEAAVEALAAAMAEREAGRDFGPLNNPDQAARYDRILSSSGAKTIRTGPGRADGLWRPATILADLPADDPAVVDEVFGPLLTVQRAADLDEAVALAESVPQALAASVWTTDLGTGLALTDRISAGEVWLNCHLAQSAELPHSGRRGSGAGTDLSALALREYQRPKTVTARLG
ncbi:aldehyde dehydrogenase family protein [Streptomyces sp. TLI_171]|uniref:aldehyde dehydrogenase family protein n=1 Tax=Streptomyces sp. TLI_171 TaxID=1938859 RepID=UPI000C198031|nr:aldehyde dehydrogenase family protein [Streptomyces sp. TLI_171]RKE17638.1 acyl-CoA reductase-like NAD-dependent aldehyde dehydrogenase [Streptomyces sp. TLI_171]